MPFSVGDKVQATKLIGPDEDHEVSEGTLGTITNVHKSKYTEDGLSRLYPYDVHFDSLPNVTDYPVGRDEIRAVPHPVIELEE